MPPPVGPRMPIYPPGGPPMGQQLFYGQGPPAMIPPQVLLKSFSFYQTGLLTFISNSLDTGINSSLYRA